MQKQAVTELLIKGLIELGIEPAEKTIAAFELYRAELHKWNKVHNITSITDDREIVIKHFLDSLLYLKALPAGKCTLCDVGSGGGFPGLPIAIVRPDVEITLLEPSRKRTAFLRQMRRLLCLANVDIVDCKAEDLVESEFDVVVTRATFSISEIIKKAGHLLRQGGYFILSKGPRTDEELKAISGSVQPEIYRCVLPFSDAERNLIKVKNLKN